VPAQFSPRSRIKAARPKLTFVRWLRRFLARLGVTSLMMLLVPLVIAALWLRFYGLPGQIKERLLLELRNRGLAVSVDRLLLDPTGGVLAERLTVYRGMDQQQIWLQVDRARIGFAWLSWWRAKPLIESASVSNAQIQLPIGEHETVDFKEVNAEVNFDSTGLQVTSAQARLLSLELVLQGRIHFGPLPQQKAATPEEMEQRGKIWRSIKNFAEEIETSQPILLQSNFDFPMSDPKAAWMQIELESRYAWWRGVPIQEVALSANLKDGLFKLNEFRVRLARGEFSVYGEWRTSDKKTELQFNSNLDFTPLAGALAGNGREIVRQFNFFALPIVSGRVRLDWSGPAPAIDLQADVDWRDFSYGNVSVDRLSMAMAYDGKRVLIPDARLISSAGTVSADFYYDASKPEVKGRLKSDLDPTILQGIFGAGIDRFLASCQFPRSGPVIEALLTGTSISTDAWNVQGSINASDFLYKNIPFKQCVSDFTFGDSKLHLPNLHVSRTEGKADGGVTYDFKNRTAQLEHVDSALAVQEVAPIFGGKFPAYVRPYRFADPPHLKINGLIDLQKEKSKLDTDLTVEVDSHSTMMWQLFKVDFAFGSPKGRLRFIGRQLAITMNESRLLQGILTGTLNVELIQPQATYETAFTLKGANFNELMKTVYKYEGTSGNFDGQGNFSGVLGDMETMNGKGEATISDGYLTTIPFLGGLSSLLSNFLPGFGFAKAHRAHANFNIAKGYVDSQNVELDSTNFTVIGNGRYQFTEDNLDLNVRVNVRGIVGLFLFPVSKLFEYKGTGPLNKVKWEPSNF
jgi:hypothetical protein